jgi:hypothetical protein
MIVARALAWMQHHFPFIAEDAYPDFDQRMDRARIDSQASILRLNAEMARETENWMSKAIKERGTE